MRLSALLFGVLSLTTGTIVAHPPEMAEPRDMVVVSDHPYCELDTSNEVACPPGTALIRVWAPPTHSILINDHPTKPQTWTGKYEGSRLYLLTGVAADRESEIVVRSIHGISEETCRHWVRSERCYRMVFSKQPPRRHHSKRGHRASHRGKNHHSSPHGPRGRHESPHHHEKSDQPGRHHGPDEHLKSMSELIEDAKEAMKAGKSAMTTSQLSLDESRKKLSKEMVELGKTAKGLNTLMEVLTIRMAEQKKRMEELQETTAQLKKLVHRDPTHFEIVSPGRLHGKLTFKNNFVHSITMTSAPAQLILQDKNQWIDEEVADKGTLKLKLYLEVLRGGQREKIEIRAGNQPLTIAVPLTTVGQDHRIGTVSIPTILNWINNSLANVAGETDPRYHVVGSDTPEQLILKCEYQLGSTQPTSVPDTVIELR